MWSVEMKPENGLRLTFCAEPKDRLVQGARRLGKVLKMLQRAAPNRKRPVLHNVEVA
jgi:DNA-binding transcriptional MocR family regulator